MLLPVYPGSQNSLTLQFGFFYPLFLVCHGTTCNVHEIIYKLNAGFIVDPANQSLNLKVTICKIFIILLNK